MSFLSYLINGISLGSIYAIIALGYTMVYGIARMLNFAHGDIIMVGGFVVFTIVSTLGLSPWLGLLVAVAICTVLGIVIEKVAYCPLRGASSLAVLITAIGVSYLLQNVALLIFGSNARQFTSIINLPNLKLADGRLTISAVTIVTIITCIVIMVGLTAFINKTRIGQAMLAVSEDTGAATLMGINVNKTISITFAIGSALAAIAGALLCSAYPSLTPYTGSMPGIKAFVAAVFGGIGSIPGALIGGVILGVIENLTKAYISSQLSDAVVFSVLIIVLLVRPTGILGKKITEKVGDMKNKKALKQNVITYGMVIAFWAVIQIMMKTGNLSSLAKGLLVPICMYVILAVSLNLTVGILGELSLGHAGFMCVGAFSGAFFTKVAESAIPSVGARFFIALLIGAAYLLVRKVISIRIPATYIVTFAVFAFIFGRQDMGYVLAAMLVVSGAFVVFVETCGFPADMDAENLASGIGNAWKMLGAVAGMTLAWLLDRRYIHFETQAVWWVQVIKVAVGMALLLAIKSGLKAPLLALLGHEGLAGGVRYFLLVLVAGAVWPLVFRPMSKWGKGKK